MATVESTVPARRRWPARVAGALLSLGLAVWVVGAWVVPRVIAGRIAAAVGGTAEVRSWWFDGRGVGLRGLTLREPGPGRPVWATADSVRADLSLGQLLREGFAAKKVVLRGPHVTLRFGADGRWLNRPRGAASAAGDLPVVVAEGAVATLRQEGRPAMVVRNVVARLGPDAGAVSVAVRSNDPEWGPFEAMGRFAPDFSSGDVTMKTGPAGVEVRRDKVGAIPFVPPAVWDFVAPDGPVDVRLTVGHSANGTTVHTEIGLRGTAVTSPSLDLAAAATTGKVVVDGARVRLEQVAGRALGGRVGASGTLDFGQTPASADVALELTNVDVAATPSRWQLHEAGVTGRLTGKARLRASLTAATVDLTGSTGEADVEGGTLGGIPVKSMRLRMTATGDDLRYDQPAPSEKKGESTSLWRRWPGAAAAAAAASLVAALQAPAAKPADPPAPKVQLPKSLNTHLELEDVEIAQLVAKAEYLLGFPFPLPVTGKLSMKADATIPLGQLKDLRGYAFHGDVTVTGASVYRVDLGRLSARLDLQNGELVLSDLRGVLVDHPSGGPNDPPPPLPPTVPKTGPIPPGGFRGTLRAALDPPGPLTAKFEGVDLPLGELAAPALPRPTPLSGVATLSVDARTDLRLFRSPAAWIADGSLRSRQIRYQDATLDAVSLRFAVANAHLDVTDVDARLEGQPLAANVGVDLAAPRAFKGRLDVSGWDVARVLAWLPEPVPFPVVGSFTAKAEASGTLEPRRVTTEGQGRFDRLTTGPVTFGDVPFRWATRDDSILVSVTDARPFGGKLQAEVAVPTTPGQPVTGFATVTDLDTAKLAATIPNGSLALAGRAGGRVDFKAPAGDLAVDARVKLAAEDLTVQGLPARNVQATVQARRGAVAYELTAESLGGNVRLRGEVPLAARGAPADAEFRAVNFRLEPLWASRGATGLLAGWQGRGAVDANIRLVPTGPDAGLYAHGIAEVRDLRRGGAANSPRPAEEGRLRGVVALTPAGWRVDPLTGTLLGGTLGGAVWGAPAPQVGGREAVGFSLRLDQLPLAGALAALAGDWAPAATGSGTLRVAGTLGEGGRATAELSVPTARVAGLPLTELRVPAELVASSDGPGTLRLRRWSARFAGGQVQGDAAFRLGREKEFTSDLTLTSLDLESIARTQTDATRPASGRVSGKVTLGGPDPARPALYRGKLDLDLDDASLVSLPVFREIDRFLGAARGGLFEHGDMLGTIANGHVVLDPLTLQGRLVQLHATGTVGFDGQLNMLVLVNTNQIIPQTGQALVAAIPGLAGLRGRDAEASLQVANFLSNRLLKFRVTGTARNPSVNLDPGAAVGGPAVGFFAGVLKLPLGFFK